MLSPCLPPQENEHRFESASGTVLRSLFAPWWLQQNEEDKEASAACFHQFNPFFSACWGTSLKLSGCQTSGPKRMKCIDYGNSNKPSLATIEFWEGCRITNDTFDVSEEKSFEGCTNQDRKMVGYITSSLVERISEASTVWMCLKNLGTSTALLEMPQISNRRIYLYPSKYERIVF